MFVRATHTRGVNCASKHFVKVGLRSEIYLCRVHVGDTANVVTHMAVDCQSILAAPVTIHSQVKLSCYSASSL